LDDPAGGSRLRPAIEKAWWSGRPRVWVLVCSPLAWLYRGLLGLRRAAYRLGLARTHDVGLPVVVVGNLVVGGAGKTPTVIALVQALRAAGWTPGVISRGHGGRGQAARAVAVHSAAADVGDEPLLIARRTGAAVWVGRDRVAAARALRAAHPEVNLIVADDGLQHLALQRRAQIIVFDDRGIGNGHLLPAGPLREPLRAAPPERSVVLYNAARPSTPWPGLQARRTLGAFLPLRAWWSGDGAAALPIDQLRGRRLLAAAGIGEPQRFFAMLEGLGLAFERLPLPDHADLQRRPWPEDDRTVIVTEKDAVKLLPDAADAARIVVATLDFALPDKTLAMLQRWLPAPPRPQRP
jgi:tetraacyldisaccharide 4'-kinase